MLGGPSRVTRSTQSSELKTRWMHSSTGTFSSSTCSHMQSRRDLSAWQRSLTYVSPRQGVAEQQQYRRPRVVCTESRLEPHRAPRGIAGEADPDAKIQEPNLTDARNQWEMIKIPFDRIFTLIDSMPRRSAKVICSFGSPTRYWSQCLLVLCWNKKAQKK